VWGGLARTVYVCTVYDRILGDFPAKIPCIHRKYRALASPTYVCVSLFCVCVSLCVVYVCVVCVCICVCGLCCGNSVLVPRQQGITGCSSASTIWMHAGKLMFLVC